MTKAQRKRAGRRYIDRMVLGFVAYMARESCPAACAHSAFLSEVAGDPYLATLEPAKPLRTKPMSERKPDAR